MDQHFNFGKRLKDIRIEHDLSQKDLAKRINTTSAAISNYERGVRIPDYETIIKLAKIYGVTTDYILGVEKKEKNIEEYNTKEKILIQKIRRLSPEDENHIEKEIDFLLSQYKKNIKEA